jgi:hypothetical protein
MRICRFLIIFIIFVLVGWSGALLSPVHAGVRLALVPWNAKQEAVPARDNPSNDAAGPARALRAAGFEVIEQRDVTRETIARLRLRHTGSCFLRSRA